MHITVACNFTEYRLLVWLDYGSDQILHHRHSTFNLFLLVGIFGVLTNMLQQLIRCIFYTNGGLPTQTTIYEMQVLEERAMT